MYKRLTITFTAADRAALDRLAQQDTRPVKDQVRALVRAEAERRHIWLDDPASADWRAHLAAGIPSAVVDDAREWRLPSPGWRHVRTRQPVSGQSGSRGRPAKASSPDTSGSPTAAGLGLPWEDV